MVNTLVRAIRLSDVTKAVFVPFTIRCDAMRCDAIHHIRQQLGNHSSAASNSPGTNTPRIKIKMADRRAWL